MSEWENRQRVAEHLADILWDAGATSADDIANLEPFVWNLAVGALAQRQAELHREWQGYSAEDHTPEPWQPKPGYSPSDQTRVMVAGLIAFRSRPVDIVMTDPFEGLPS